MDKTCRSCEHCAARHMKPDINTSGEYVCMVLGSLVPDAYLDSAMCSGLYYDQAPANKDNVEVSAVEAAEMLGVSRNRILQLCSSGQIEGRKMAGAWIVSKASVEERKANPPAPHRPKKRQ